MKALRGVGAAALALLWVLIASRFPEAGLMWLGGLAVAGAVLAGLPLVLALDAHRPLAASARTEALQTRRTAVMLLGAGALVGAVVLLGGLADNGKGAVAMAIASLVYGVAMLGFGAAARITGALIDPHGGTTRQFVLGWVVRALVLATPLLWPALLAYQVMTSLGCSLVGAMTAPGVPETDSAEKS